jgi:hypothetical protein
MFNTYDLKIIFCDHKPTSNKNSRFSGRAVSAVVMYAARPASMDSA